MRAFLNVTLWSTTWLCGSIGDLDPMLTHTVVTVDEVRAVSAFNPHTSYRCALTPDSGLAQWHVLTTSAVTGLKNDILYDQN